MDRHEMVDTSNQVIPSASSINMVLIDDDPVFCSLMAEQARRNGIDLHCFHDLMEVQDSRRSLHTYDVAILDYQLEHMNGLEVAQWIPMFFNDMPIVLVSYEDRNAGNTTLPWPVAVSTFVHKRKGVQAILKKALELGGHSELVIDLLSGVQATESQII